MHNHEKLEDFCSLCDELYCAIMVSSDPAFTDWRADIRDGYYRLMSRAARQLREQAEEIVERAA